MLLIVALWAAGSHLRSYHARSRWFTFVWCLTNVVEATLIIMYALKGCK